MARGNVSMVGRISPHLEAFLLSELSTIREKPNVFEWHASCYM